jgi:hypothetical protein
VPRRRLGVIQDGRAAGSAARADGPGAGGAAGLAGDCRVSEKIGEPLHGRILADFAGAMADRAQLSGSCATDMSWVAEAKLVGGAIWR